MFVVNFNERVYLGLPAATRFTDSTATSETRSRFFLKIDPLLIGLGGLVLIAWYALMAWQLFRLSRAPAIQS